MIATNFRHSITNQTTKRMIEERLGTSAISPDAIARGILYAVRPSPEGDVGSIVIHPTAQG
jgi:NADP-dependent 3-hydroxy acid dehydrogenase YdfG